MADKELTAKLKVLARFSQNFSKDKRNPYYYYFNRVFVHNDIMYATNGHIFCYTKNITDNKDFSFWYGKELAYLDKNDKSVQEVSEKLADGETLEKIIGVFNHSNLSFDIDLTDFILPVKLCVSWSYRYTERCIIDTENQELIFNFSGGKDELGGVTATYEEVITGVTGDKVKFTLPIWYVLEIMRATKTKKLHFECYTDRGHVTCKVNEYTFLMMMKTI